VDYSVNRANFSPDYEDDAKVITRFLAGPYAITVMTPRKADIQKLISIFKRRSRLDGKWEGKVVTQGPPKVIELTAIVAPSMAPGAGVNAEEVRVFFGTLEHKKVYVTNFPDEQILETAKKKLRMDSCWAIQGVFLATKKTPKIIVAELKAVRPVRQALLAGIPEFIVVYVEKGLKIAEKRIKCQANESPARQVELVAKAYDGLMDISDWEERMVRSFFSVQQQLSTRSHLSWEKKQHMPGSK
jgi:hypothetical protein